MTIATRVENYLAENDIPFQLLSHNSSKNSIASALAANIPKSSIAKGIVLEDHQGNHLMAVLPADSKISLSVLNLMMRANYHLVKEKEVYALFKDCDNGAVPPIGTLYHMMTICETTLSELDEVFLEAGDHKTLIKLDKEAFKQAMSHSKWLHFSSPVFH